MSFWGQNRVSFGKVKMGENDLFCGHIMGKRVHLGLNLVN